FPELRRSFRRFDHPMAITDILLPLSSYPNPTGTDAIERAVAFARRLDAHVTAVAFGIDIQPAIGIYVAPLGVAASPAGARKKSAENARALLAAVTTLADKLGVAHEERLMCCRPLDIPGRVAAEARFRDISIVPLPEDQQAQDIAETLIFEAGRPVLVFPEWPRGRLTGEVETVVVAWDLSRPAARAVADARPFLQRAQQGRPFPVGGDKPPRDARP